MFCRHENRRKLQNLKNIGSGPLINKALKSKFSERVSKDAGAIALIQIVNSSFRRRTKFVLSMTENKYPKKP